VSEATLALVEALHEAADVAGAVARYAEGRGAGHEAMRAQALAAVRDGLARGIFAVESG
jgi:hypothetical protein